MIYEIIMQKAVFFSAIVRKISDLRQEVWEFLL
jgi:hypothetical protein